MGFAAALGDLGYHDEARQVWSELMSINPAYSFADRIAPMPFKKPEDLARIAKGLKSRVACCELGGLTETIPISRSTGPAFPA